MIDTTDQKRPSEKLSPHYDDSAYKHLKQAIGDYLQWMKAVGYAPKTRQSYQAQLNQFLYFIKNNQISRQQFFTSKSLEGFKKITGQSRLPAIKGLSRYLFSQGHIPQPAAQSAQRTDLPQIYEDYLAYQQNHRQASARLISSIKRVLAAFDDYLQTHKIDLGTLKIEQVDAFLAEFLAPFKAASRRIYRCRLRAFLTYLYRERNIIKTDLAPLVLGRREYAQAKPPKFLRPEEVQKLFAGLTLRSASDIRTYAMVHLAYTMGLRLKEISRISLDEISFSTQLLTLTDRKGNNPVEHPMPEHTVKVIAAYVLGVRPKSGHRSVFLTIPPPFRPISPSVVGHHITKAMQKVALNSTAYWLRHTYAQNMLESGASIFEIKEMLGHDKIESTKLYLHVHLKLMRKVLFDETF